MDVTIFGAGVFGLSVGWACVSRGAKVQVIDPHGVAAGASGGIVGALAPHVPENWNDKKAFQLASLLASAHFWAGVEAASGLGTGYGRTGRVQPLTDARAVEMAQVRAEGAEALWQGQAIWEVVTAYLPSPTGLMIHDTLSARIHPRRACEALAAAITGHGGQVLKDGTAQGMIVHATGWQGLDALSEGRDRTMGAGVKGQAALLRCDLGTHPQVFADGLHIVPHDDGTLAVGSTSERDLTSPAKTDAQIEGLIARARAALPALRDAPVIQRWAGVRPRARSRAPMLGAWPDRQGHFIANGGFKIGFGMAPGVARVMADLVLEGRVTYPPGFDVNASL